MENPSRYDLNAAIQSWRQELASQPNLTEENRRELETHLRDTIAGLQRLGLNEEESFWLARRRVGPPQQIGEEFLKADPTAAWRERALWMALGCGSIQFWVNLVSFIPLHRLLSVYGWLLLLYLPVICGVILLAKGKLDKSCHLLASLFNSRRRFVLTALVFLGIVQGSHYKYMIQMDNARSINVFWMNTFTQIIWPLMLVTLITWLLPAQNRKTLKRA